MLDEDTLSQVKKDIAVLARIESLVSTAAFNMICDDMAQSNSTYGFEIVDKTDVKGVTQDDVQFEFGERLVNQTLNGGWSGDEYAGEVYIPISQDKYFKYCYYM
jgi:hypothetical protein